MGKKINVKPIETLTLEFLDGVTKDIRFSAYAMMILDEEFEGFKAIFTGATEKPFLNGAKLMYAGVKACKEDVTFKEVKRLAVKMNIEDIMMLFDFAAECFGDMDEKKFKTTQRKK